MSLPFGSGKGEGFLDHECGVSKHVSVCLCVCWPMYVHVCETAFVNPAPLQSLRETTFGHRVPDTSLFKMRFLLMFATFRYSRSASLPCPHRACFLSGFLSWCHPHGPMSFLCSLHFHLQPCFLTSLFWKPLMASCSFQEQSLTPCPQRPLFIIHIFDVPLLSSNETNKKGDLIL